MSRNDDATEQLLDRAGAGSRSAVERLLELYRPRLRKAVDAWMDERLSARLDPSDIVQEALKDATGRLPEYLDHRRVPFYPWLRAIALDRLADARRRHVGASRRSVLREEAGGLPLPDKSSVALAQRLFAQASSASRHLRRAEETRRVREALDLLAPQQRDVLVLRYLEDCSGAEIAAELGVTERTVRRLHRRALEKLSHELRDLFAE